MGLLRRVFRFLFSPCLHPREPGASRLHSPLLGVSAAATLLIGVLVLTGNMMLSPGDGQGLAQFVSGCETAATVRESWEQHNLVPWARGMLILDSVWILAYAPFLALLIARLVGEIRADFPGERRLRLLCGVYGLGLATVLALGVADLLENWTAIVVLGGGSENLAPAPDSLTARASMAKTWLAGASLLLAAGLLLTWFFNLFNLKARRDPGSGRRTSQRALLRLGVGDIVWRSRYVMFTLAFFAAIALAMDQGRDILVGMAQGIDEPGRWPWVAGGIAFSVLGVWVFAYACWLWSRVMARMLRPDDEVLGVGAGTTALPRPDGRDVFAKWWARLLGMAPFLMLAWLCGLASRDAMRAGIQGTGVLLFWFGAAAVLLAAFVLGARAYDKGRIRHSGPVSDRLSEDKRRGRYFDVVGNGEAPCELSGSRYRFLWAIPDAPLLLPILSLVLFELVRGLDLALDGRTPLTLAAIALALSLWTSVLGLIGQVALRRSVPWVLFLFLAIGILGGLGWTDNHRVWTAASGAAGPTTLWLMWGFQALLALVVLGALAWVYFRVVSSSDDEGKGCRYKFDWPRTRYGGWAAVAIGLPLSVALVLWGADKLIFRAHGAEAKQAHKEDPLGERETLDRAIVSWVQGLKADLGQENGKAAEETPVYFVSAEGGGIRSAYWTALVLDHLSRNNANFARQTFSVSGVSGGSVGAAVWSVCEADGEKDAQEPNPCVSELGKANLLTPLVSAWLFEDILARLIPTVGCDLPGCGIMSRGNWFERSLEQDVVGLADPIIGPSSAKTGRPYLFLNSTWVENGERAVASRIEIDPAFFPAAGDQLSQIGRDLLLSTAAHNSARFTYVNALGSVVGTDGHGDGDQPADDRRVRRGHLADGGYFDNSGGHTTDDILRAFRRCLFEPDDPCGMGADLREWAQERLVPQAIQIRNGVGVQTSREDPAACTVQCPADFHEPVKSLSWYSDLLGPVFTAFNAIGTGSNGRVAEANICKSIEAWRRLRMAEQEVLPPASWLPPMRRIDLAKGAVLYPLGWYLSPTAREGMECAALKVVDPSVRCPKSN